MDITEELKAKIKRYAKIAGIAVIVILSIVGIFTVGKCSRKTGTNQKMIIKVDTLTIRDTIRIEKPVPITKRIIDTILVEVTKFDTVRIRDTVYLSLPREQKQYRTKDYHAYISGYRPELDSLKIFTTTQQIISSATIQPQPQSSQRQTPKRWGIGIQAGYGLTIQNNAVKFSPYVGIGVSWNVVSL